jgi:hypothetical protein
MCIDASGRIGSGRVLFSLFSRSMRRQRERGGSGPKTTRRRGGGGGACWWSGQIEVFFSVHEKAARGRANLWGRPQREAWRGEPQREAWRYIHIDIGTWRWFARAGGGCGRRMGLVVVVWSLLVCWTRITLPRSAFGKRPLESSPVVLAWLLARSAARAPSRSGADC